MPKLSGKACYIKHLEHIAVGGEGIRKSGCEDEFDKEDKIKDIVKEKSRVSPKDGLGPVRTYAEVVSKGVTWQPPKLTVTGKRSVGRKGNAHSFKIIQSRE